MATGPKGVMEEGKREGRDKAAPKWPGNPKENLTITITGSAR